MRRRERPPPSLSARALDFCRALVLLSLAAAATAIAPNTQACCAANGVNPACVRKLCNVDRPPNEFEVFDAATQCPRFLPVISRCLADGRDHMPCCKARSRGVEEECLHLCSGSAQPLNTSNWPATSQYISCLTFNVRNMYSCMRAGYLQAPGPPQDVTADAVGATDARISWTVPATLPHVVHHYEVFLDDGSVLKQHQQQPEELAAATTQSTVYEFRNLSPDTKYAVYVRASGAQAEGRSLRSDVLQFVTSGIAPQVSAYRSDVLASQGSSVTLVCLLSVFGSEHLHSVNVQWMKQSSSGAFAPLSTDAQSIETGAYLTTGAVERRVRRQGARRTQVLYMRIRTMRTTDFSKYRCSVTNGFGQAAADIDLREAVDGSAMPDAPTNLTACCLREGVDTRCLATCQRDGAQPLNASLYTTNVRCALDVPKVLKCSTDGLNYGACCLRQRVPMSCLPFCDGTLRFPLAYGMYKCLLHTSDIIGCHLEAKAALPSPPDELHVSAKSSRTASVSWTAAPRALEYFVYHRPAHTSAATSWSRQRTAATELTIVLADPNAVYEVIVHSANSAGLSDGSSSLYVSSRSGGAQRDAPVDLGRESRRFRLGTRGRAGRRR